MPSDAGAARGRGTTRKAVLKAAMEAIADVGADRVRIQDVADRAGISSGHVIYYLKNRERILVETLLLSEADLAERRDRQLGRTATWRDALETLVRLYLPSGSSDTRWKLWAQLIARPPTDAETLKALARVIDSWSEALAHVLRDGVEAGSLPAVECDAIAYRTCRLMDGYSLEILLGTPGRSRTWAVRSVLATLERDLSMG